MCGIILMDMGVEGRTQEQGLAAMAAMGYRGKDGKMGWTQIGGFFLGHVRLAIQDLSDESHQPLEEDDMAFAFVGEVFNHNAKSELRALFEGFRDRQGPYSFQDYDGFWAGAAVSTKYCLATVWTDHLSLKPLYYWPAQRIVCSELEPMFAIAPRPQYNPLYMVNTIKFGYTHDGTTPYQGIVQLPAGTFFQLPSKKFHPHAPPYSSGTYWDWSKLQLPFMKPDAQMVKKEVIQATLNRLISDREVSLLVSGGLDSTIVYSILRHHNIARKAYSIENGESEYLPESVIRLELDESDGALDEALMAHQVPVDLGSMVPQYQLAQVLARQGVNVCMTGDGADELFGGYRRAKEYDSQLSDIFCEIPFYHAPRLDRLMMRHTIELRSPFLAPKVVALAMMFPWEVRQSKQILKEAFKDMVPTHILNREKKPLKTPQVIEGGFAYRRKLVNRFLEIHYATGNADGQLDR